MYYLLFQNFPINIVFFFVHIPIILTWFLFIKLADMHGKSATEWQWAGCLVRFSPGLVFILDGAGMDLIGLALVVYLIGKKIDVMPSAPLGRIHFYFMW